MTEIVQLTYANLRSTPDHSGGWQVKQTTGEPTPAEQKVLLERVSFAFRAAAQTAKPSRLLAVRTAVGLALWRQESAGFDAANRPGNVFTHALLFRNGVGPASPFRPIDLWRAEGWLRPDDLEAVEASRLGSPPLSPPASDPAAEVLAFLRPKGRWDRVDAWLVLLDLVDAALRGQGPPLVLSVADADEGARWIAAISHMLPRGWAARLGFSTYETAASLGNTLVSGGVHLAALGRQDLAEAQRSGSLEHAVVLDLTGADNRLADISAAGRRAAVGGYYRLDQSADPRTARKTPWWSLVDQILGYPPEQAAQLWNRADEAESVWLKAGVDPDPWQPLAAALAYAPEAASSTQTSSPVSELLESVSASIRQDLTELWQPTAEEGLRHLAELCRKGKRSSLDALAQGIRAVNRVLASDSPPTAVLPAASARQRLQPGWLGEWDELALAGDLRGWLCRDKVSGLLAQVGQVAPATCDFVRRWLSQSSDGWWNDAASRTGGRLAKAALEWLSPDITSEINAADLLANGVSPALGDFVDRQRLYWQWRDWSAGAAAQPPFFRAVATLLELGVFDEKTAGPVRLTQLPDLDLSQLTALVKCFGCQNSKGVLADWLDAALVKTEPGNDLNNLLKAVQYSDKIYHLECLIYLRMTESDPTRGTTVAQQNYYEWLTYYSYHVENQPRTVDPADSLILGAQARFLHLAVLETPSEKLSEALSDSTVKRVLSDPSASDLIAYLQQALTTRQQAAGALASLIVQNDQQPAGALLLLADALADWDPLRKAAWCKVRIENNDQPVFCQAAQPSDYFRPGNAPSAKEVLKEFCRGRAELYERLVSQRSVLAEINRLLEAAGVRILREEEEPTTAARNGQTQSGGHALAADMTVPEKQPFSPDVEPVDLIGPPSSSWKAPEQDHMTILSEGGAQAPLLAADNSGQNSSSLTNLRPRHQAGGLPKRALRLNKPLTEFYDSLKKMGINWPRLWLILIVLGALVIVVISLPLIIHEISRNSPLSPPSEQPSSSLPSVSSLSPTPSAAITDEPSGTTPSNETEAVPADPDTPPDVADIKIESKSDSEGITYTWTYPDQRDKDTYQVIIAGDVKPSVQDDPAYRLNRADFENYHHDENGLVCLQVQVIKPNGALSGADTPEDPWSQPPVCAKPL
ncbi:MAG: hypothetical protein LBI84_02315 [Propionibacteriaceae bacterium]|jgi:hypothetical protein|nr:hypothetical protein [Propionibacteriaceae bacterium]